MEEGEMPEMCIFQFHCSPFAPAVTLQDGQMVLGIELATRLRESLITGMLAMDYAEKLNAKPPPSNLERQVQQSLTPGKGKGGGKNRKGRP